ncbi:MAG: hypothetical protein ACR2MP_06430 [Streptosporangiaceae bacterium]
MMFVSRPDHPLAGRKRVAFKSLADQDFAGPLLGWNRMAGGDWVFPSAGKAHYRRCTLLVTPLL